MRAQNLGSQLEVAMTATMNEAKERASAAASQPIDKMLDRLGERIGTQASVKAVFGEPVERGDVTVIPVARVRWGLGAGTGTGPVDAAAANGDAAGSGSGAGGGAMADPMGYLEVRPTGATYVPLGSAYPNPALVLAVGISLGIVVRALARLVRG
jgi:uncharacterized spore protein YtfJ